MATQAVIHADLGHPNFLNISFHRICRFQKICGDSLFLEFVPDHETIKLICTQIGRHLAAGDLSGWVNYDPL